MNRREFLAAAAAAPLAVRVMPAGAASGPAALVTCDAEARLAVVDLLSLRIVGVIHTLPDPRSIELVGRHAVVCHTAVGAVSIVDTVKRRVRHLVRGFVEPRYTAGHPDGRHAFVTDSGRSGVVAVDVEQGTVAGRAPLGGWARHVSLDASGRTLWVGLGSASPDVAIVDVSNRRRPRHVRTFSPPFLAHDVGFAPGKGAVWVTSGDKGMAGIFDGAGDAHVRLRADAAPQHVTFDRDRAYVTSGDAGTLHVQRIDDGRILRAARIPVGSYNVQAGLGHVITPSLDRGTLAVLDRHGSLLGVVQVADSCHDACFSAA